MDFQFSIPMAFTSEKRHVWKDLLAPAQESVITEEIAEEKLPDEIKDAFLK